MRLQTCIIMYLNRFNWGKNKFKTAFHDKTDWAFALSYPPIFFVENPWNFLMLAILHISYDRLRGSYEFLRLFPRVSPERPRNTYFDLMQIQYKNRWFRASAFRELWEWPTSYNMKTRDWLVFRNIFFWFISTPFSNIVSKYTNKTTSFEILYILAIYPFLKNGVFSDSGIKTLLLLFSCIWKQFTH